MWRLACVLMISLAVLPACSENDKKHVAEILRHVDVTSGIATVVNKSDTLIISDVLTIDGAPALTEYKCAPDANTCTRTTAPLFAPPESVTALADLARAVTDADLEQSDIRDYKGVGLAEYRVTRKDGNSIEWTTIEYGAWLDESGLATVVASGVKPDDGNVFAAYSISFGRRNDQAPAGDATWEGLMLGATRTNTGKTEPLQGDAILNFKLDVMTMDVYFSGIKNMTTARDHPDMRFDEVAVSNGVFTKTTANARIFGRFYGGDHEEVGGVFTNATALGSFGARQVGQAE